MKPMTRIGLLAALVVLLPSSLFGYSTLGGAWPNWGYGGAVASYYIGAGSTDSQAGTYAQQIAAIRAGADAWASQSSAAFGYSYAGTTSTSVVSHNGQNAVFFRPDTSTTALAATYTWISGGTMTEFDTIFYDASWTFSLNPSTGYDIQAIATHELGHGLGLGHSASSSAVMYTYYNAVRNLSSDDVSGVQAIYGIRQYCGDGTCQFPNEDSNSCPEDCGSCLTGGNFCDRDDQCCSNYCDPGFGRCN